MQRYMIWRRAVSLGAWTYDDVFDNHVVTWLILNTPVSPAEIVEAAEKEFHGIPLSTLRVEGVGEFGERRIILFNPEEPYESQRKNEQAAQEQSQAD
jgi:hypothetical protein